VATLLESPTLRQPTSFMAWIFHLCRRSLYSEWMSANVDTTVREAQLLQRAGEQSRLGSLRQGTGEDCPSDSLPFTHGWLGWLGYDIAWEIERLPCLKSDHLPFPCFLVRTRVFCSLRPQANSWLASDPTSWMQNHLETSPPAPLSPSSLSSPQLFSSSPPS